MNYTLKKVIALLVIIGFMSLSHVIEDKAYAAEILEVGESRSLGTTVEVPVTLRDTMYLGSGNFTITTPTNQGVELKSFRPTPAFNQEMFRTKWKVENNTLDLNFLSASGKEERFMDKKIIIGYLQYELSDTLKENETVKISIQAINMKGRQNTDFIVTPMDGKIIRQMPVGDVVGNNKPTAAAAIRILQHLNKPITDPKAFASADVNADGVLTQEDAQMILDFIAGKRTTFLAIQSKKLDNAILENEYSEQINVLNGRAPYTFKRSGSLPAGLNFNETTGEISGIPKRAGNFSFTIQVTDAVGDIEKRLFSIQVIDSNISTIEKPLPINVKLNETPELPTHVNVTYKNQTTGKEPVIWELVDTSTIGTFLVKGKMEELGFTVTVEVNVIVADYFKEIKVAYHPFLSIHTIIVDASTEVNKVTLDAYSMNLGTDNKFSLVSSNLKPNSTVVFRLYDKYGTLLETKPYVLKPN